MVSQDGVTQVNSDKVFGSLWLPLLPKSADSARAYQLADSLVLRMEPPHESERLESPASRVLLHCDSNVLPTCIVPVTPGGS